MPCDAACEHRPPTLMVITSHEWTSLSLSTIFTPRGYTAVRVPTAARALGSHAGACPDLIIIDRELGDMSGMQLCALLRRDGCDAPIVLFSTETWVRSERVAALQAGAWDVCSLPMDGEELFLRFDAWARFKRDRDLIRAGSLLDPATRLYNAQGFLRMAAEITAAARRHARPLACLVVVAGDGPASGPEVPLAAIVERLALMLPGVLRASDALGRIHAGGLAIMAPETPPADAERLAGRIRDYVAACGLAAEFPGRIRVGCCAIADMGTTTVDPDEFVRRAILGAAADRLHETTPTPAALAVRPSGAGLN